MQIVYHKILMADEFVHLLVSFLFGLQNMHAIYTLELMIAC